MARNKVEEKKVNLDIDFDLDESQFDVPLKEVPSNDTNNNVSTQSNTAKIKPSEVIDTPKSCLRNERIIVRYIPRLNGIWGNNPKHVLSGGMAEGASRTYVVPRRVDGLYVNVLTDDEKAFLEEIMGLEFNALSIYKKVNNFWDDSTEEGINRVRLTKGDNYLNLASPSDYIKYKILLANKDYIAPSLQALQDYPKATYQFVIISEGDETKSAKNNMSTTMKCYKEFGKIEDDVDTLRMIIELIDNRPTSKSSKLEFLQTKANEFIQANSKLFLKVITDPLLQTKVLIKKSIEAGLISNRGNYLYLREDNSPLCEHNEEPTLNIAAKYLNSPKHQDTLFMLQAKLK